MESSGSETSSESHSNLVPSIVPIGEPSAPKTQSETERDFRNRLNSLDPTLEQELLQNSELDNQISQYIDIDTDYQSIINGFVTENVSEDSKILIVDYENVAWATYSPQRDNKGNPLKPYIHPLDRSVLYPNVNKEEIFYYRIATYLILNYACKNNFTKVFVVCKTKKSEEYFLGDFNAIKDSGEIVFTERVGNINVKINCRQIQTAITSSIQCTSFRINSGFTLSENCDKIKCHRIMGSDDSVLAVLAVLVYNRIQTDKLSKIFIMSRDGRIFLDFANDQSYCIPFNLKITNLFNTRVIDDFVVNFTKRQFNLPGEINDRTFTKIIANRDFVSEYYYGRSQQITGTENYDVKNWYKRTGNDISNALINGPRPDGTTYTVPYVDGSGRVPLNASSKPYLDESGNYIKINGTDIPYTKYDPTTRTFIPSVKFTPYVDSKGGTGIRKVSTPSGARTPYCYLENGYYYPALLNGQPYKNERGRIQSIVIGVNEANKPIWKEYCYWKNGNYFPILDQDYYRDASNNISNITYHEWQPYFNKYNVNESGDSNDSYYVKYLKYKAKYNNLKKKLGL